MALESTTGNSTTIEAINSPGGNRAKRNQTITQASEETMLTRQMRDHTMRSGMSSMVGTTIQHGSQSLVQGPEKFRKRHTVSKAEPGYTKKEQ